LQKGISYKSEDYCHEDDGYAFINLKCVSKSGGFNQEGVKYFKGYVPDSQKIEIGDLLIANTDLTRAGDIIGCPMIVDEISGKMGIAMSMDLSRVDVDRVKINKKYLYFCLMMPSARKFMKGRSSGSTVLHLHTRAVPSLELFIPQSVLEQSKIAEIISTVDEAIDKTEELIAKYQRIKQGLMQDLLTKGIDEHGQIRSEKIHRFKDSPLGRSRSSGTI